MFVCFFLKNFQISTVNSQFQYHYGKFFALVQFNICGKFAGKIGKMFSNLVCAIYICLIVITNQFDYTNAAVRFLFFPIHFFFKLPIFGKGREMIRLLVHEVLSFQIPISKNR